MDTDGRAVPEDVEKVLRGADFFLGAERKAEAVVGLAELAKPGEIADHDEHRFAVENLSVDAAFDLRREPLHGVGHAQPAHHVDIVRQALGECGEQDLGLLLGDRGLEEHEPAGVAQRSARVRIMACRQAHHRHRQERRGQVVSLADDQHVGTTLTAEDGRRGILDRDRVAQPDQRRRELAAVDGVRGEQLFQQRIAGRIGGFVAVEHHAGHGRDVGAPIGELAQRAEISLAPLVVQKHHLKRAVAGHHAVGVVVDRLTRPGEEPGGGVVFGEDQARIGLVALQCHPHGHLPHRGSRQAVGAAERLGAENHVHAEGTALPDEPIENQRGFLRELVVFDEDFLKLVDQQHQPGHRIGVAGGPESRHVLHGQIAKQVATALQLAIELLEHRETELALTLDRDHAGMRQLVVVVELELDAFLEVDQVKLDFVGAVLQREARDHRVHERRFAGARLAGDERMLARAFAELEILQLLGARRTKRCQHLARRALRPPLVLGRCHAVERHLDPLGGLGGLAHALDDPRARLVGRRPFRRERPLREFGVGPGEGAVFEDECGGVLLELRKAEIGRHRRLRVDRHDEIDAAAGAAGGDARQPPGARFGEVRRKIGDDDEPIGLRHFGDGVVIADRGVFVAEVFLDHHLHLFGDVGEPLLDLLRLGPDAVGDEQFVVIGEMHEARELLAEPQGVDDREPTLPRRNAGGDAEHERVHHVGGRFLLVGRGLDQERCMLRKRHERRLGPGDRAEGVELGVGRHSARDLFERQGLGAEPQPRRGLRGQGHRLVGELGPRAKGRGVDLVDGVIHGRRRRAGVAPAVGHLPPAVVAARGDGGEAFGAGHFEPLEILPARGFERCQPGWILLVGRLLVGHTLVGDFLDLRPVFRFQVGGLLVFLRGDVAELGSQCCLAIG